MRLLTDTERERSRALVSEAREADALVLEALGCESLLPQKLVQRAARLGIGTPALRVALDRAGAETDWQGRLCLPPEETL